MLHKLRRAMVRPGRERLSGRVEVDETYVGGAEEGLRGRQTQKEDGAGIGRPYEALRGASKQLLHGFIEAVEPDSTIHTDGWEGYRRPGGSLAKVRKPVGLPVAPRSPGGCPFEALVDRDAPKPVSRDTSS